MNTSVEPAQDRVASIVDELGGSTEFEEKATELAETAHYDAQVTRTPNSIAAGAVYAAGLLVNEKRTQPKVSAVSDVSVGTIREAYRDVLVANGWPRDVLDEQERVTTRQVIDEETAFGDRVRNLLPFGGDDDE